MMEHEEQVARWKRDREASRERALKRIQEADWRHTPPEQCDECKGTGQTEDFYSLWPNGLAQARITPSTREPGRWHVVVRRYEEHRRYDLWRQCQTESATFDTLEEAKAQGRAWLEVRP